jgi:hypothetical protein
LSTERFQENAVGVFDNQRISKSLLSEDFSQNGHVVFAATEKVHHSFIPEAGRPDGEGVVLCVLLVGILEDVGDVGGPLVVAIDGHLSSREEDSIDFAEDVIELGVGVVIVERKNLSSSHLEILHVTCTDIGLLVLRRLPEVIGIFSIDADDRVLRRKRHSSCQQNCKKEIGRFHHRRINYYFTLFNWISHTIEEPISIKRRN